MVYNLRITSSTIIRVDPHSSFQSLEKDEILDNHNIKIEIGHKKNINKNSVAEKAIQELEDELVKISPHGSQIDDMILAKATDQLNCKIRHTHRSAKELLLKRNQFTGDDIEVDDLEVSDKQFRERKNKNEQKLKKTDKKKEKKEETQTKFKVGDIVFIISDKNKHKTRDTYVITKIHEELLTLVKAKRGRTAGKKYLVKPENVYKAVPDTKATDEIQNEDSDKEKEKENLKTKKKSHIVPEKRDTECFFCKQAGYIDFYHSKLTCRKYLETTPPIKVTTRKKHDESSSSSDEEEDEVEEDAATGDGDDEDRFEDAPENPDSDMEEIPREEVMEQIEEPEPPPKPPDFVKPKKGDSIKYFDKQSEVWRTVIILSSIRGYGGTWYNVERENKEKLSVSLSKDSVWKFTEHVKNRYFEWRWPHLHLLREEDEQDGDREQEQEISGTRRTGDRLHGEDQEHGDGGERE